MSTPTNQGCTLEQGFPLIGASGNAGLVGFEEISADPRVAGLNRPIGAQVFWAAQSTTYRKFGTSNTDWREGKAYYTFVQANATRVTIASGLQGNEAGGYDIVCRVVSGLAGTTYSIEPNGLGTGQYTRGVQVGAAVAAFADTKMRMGSSDTGLLLELSGKFYSRVTNANRRSLLSWCFADKAAAAGTIEYAGSSWTDTTNEVTSIDLVADIALGIQASSEIWVIPWQ